MGMSHAYTGRDDAESIATLELALDMGLNFWDTADFYGSGLNEALISKVLVPNRNKVFIATKFGFRVIPGNPYAVDGSPAYMKHAVEASLKRLGVETIDLYYLHRIDPNVPVEESVGAMSRLVEEGKVRFLGLSEASPDTLLKANAIHPIAALQSEYSLITREVEREVLPLCDRLGIGFVPFSPLSRGLVTGKVKVDLLDTKDFRLTLPRFSGSYWDNNRALADGFAELAGDLGATPAQLALAWVLSRGEGVIPIPGTRRREHLVENCGAMDLKLGSTDLLAIDELLARFPNTGPRYNQTMNNLVRK